MKHILITTIVAVLVVGCGESQLPKLPAFNASDILIHTAAEAGNIEAVKQHLAEGADVNARSVIDDTPLHFAAGEGHKEVVELLIANGADVNAKGGISGSTPLHFAALFGHKEVVELLIAKGADVNAKDDMSGSIPLDLAGGETADLLRKHGGKTSEELKAEGK
jgi:ankyrin repeat protein